MSFEFVEKLEFNSEYFDLYKLSESAYAAISKENSVMRSNAGFVNLGDFSLVIDTTMSIKAAEDLKKATLQYTKKDPKFIVITHFHIDHVIGNSLFDQSTLIITSDRTLNSIKTENQKRIEEIRNIDLRYIAKIEESLKVEQDEEKRQIAQRDLKFYKSVRAENFFLRDPDLSFKKEFILYGKERTVQLKTFNKAHTDGDVIVYIPSEKVMFAGDLLFANRDPWLGSGDPDGWVKVIENELLNFDFKVVVPGHGNLASKEEFVKEKKYIILSFSGSIGYPSLIVTRITFSNDKSVS